MCLYLYKEVIINVLYTSDVPCKCSLALASHCQGDDMYVAVASGCLLGTWHFVSGNGSHNTNPVLLRVQLGSASFISPSSWHWLQVVSLRLTAHQVDMVVRGFSQVVSCCLGPETSSNYISEITFSSEPPSQFFYLKDRIPFCMCWITLNSTT